MPVDPITMSALFGLGSSALGGYLGFKNNQSNIDYQNQTNAENRQHQWDMYWRQREDAMSDWNRNNAYNSPLQQMQRLREAGLNPNLVYGKGAENTAQMARAASVSPQNQNAPRSENYLGQAAMGAIGQINQLLQSRQIQAQTDNLHANNALLLKESIYKDALTAKTMSETANNEFQLKQSNALYDQVIKKAQLENDLLDSQSFLTTRQGMKLEQEWNFNLDDRERNILKQENDILLGMEKIISERLNQAKTKAEAENLRQMLVNLQNVNESEELRQVALQYINELNQAGITVNSPFYAQILAKLWRNLLELDK